MDHEPLPPDDRRRGTLLVMAALFEGSLVLISLGVGWLFDVSPPRMVRWEWAGLGWGLAGVLPMLVGLAFILRTSWAPLVRMRNAADETVGVLFTQASWSDVAVISLLAGVGEEALFRGALQSPLAEAWGIWPAIVSVSAIFGLAHALTRTYMAVAFLMSVYLGWLFHFTDNLLAPIVTHAVYDFIALGLLLRKVEYHAPADVSQRDPP